MYIYIPTRKCGKSTLELMHICKTYVLPGKKPPPLPHSKSPSRRASSKSSRASSKRSATGKRKASKSIKSGPLVKKTIAKEKGAASGGKRSKKEGPYTQWKGKSIPSAEPKRGSRGDLKCTCQMRRCLVIAWYLPRHEGNL